METSIDYQSKGFVLLLGVIASVLIAFLTSSWGLVVPIMTIVLGGASLLLIFVSRNPILGLYCTLIYCYYCVSLERDINILFPFGYIVELLFLVVLIAAYFKNRGKVSLIFEKDLVLLFTLWFAISVLQLINPADASFYGWLSEIRTSGFDSFILVFIGFLTIHKVKHLNFFIGIILVCSFVATLNGARQLLIGLLPGEKAFLDFSTFHMVWGQLRVFSFYRDAGQFGASQACFAVISGVLAFGPFKLWKRILFFLLAVAFFYGMLISGTRGALFALVSGIFLATFLFKDLKVLLCGSIFLILFVLLLKFTFIGSEFSYIHRLRSALDTSDASLNVRLINQSILSEYLKVHPFGGGLGVMGYAGEKYNSDKFLSTIPPDSYWVKVWGMYGIVGLTFWFCMMMYIFGKCCGIIWNLKSEGLRVKLIALIAGAFGIFVCSYGNEVINALPSSIIVYLSFVLIFMGPRFDREIQESLKN